MEYIQYIIYFNAFEVRNQFCKLFKFIHNIISHLNITKQKLDVWRVVKKRRMIHIDLYLCNAKPNSQLTTIVIYSGTMNRMKLYTWRFDNQMFELISQPS